MRMHQVHGICTRNRSVFAGSEKKSDAKDFMPPDGVQFEDTGCSACRICTADKHSAVSGYWVTDEWLFFS